MGVWAFSNGTAYMDWEYRNCDRCTKGYQPGMNGVSPCDLNNAIFEAGAGDGHVSAAMAKRLGWTDDEIGHGQCPELEPA